MCDRKREKKRIGNKHYDNLRDKGVTKLRIKIILHMLKMGGNVLDLIYFILFFTFTISITNCL